MTRTTFLVALALATSAVGGVSQESARARAERALPADVFAQVDALAREVAGQGISEEPLFTKALEGVAKRVPAERIPPVLHAFAGRLVEARGVLGPAAHTGLLVAGADALQRGVSPEALRALGDDAGRTPVAVLVLAELVESGVPHDRALAVLREAAAQRTREERMLDIPARVRQLIREGRGPHEAAEQVRRALQRGRGNGDVGPPVPPGSEPPTRARRGGTAPAAHAPA